MIKSVQSSRPSGQQPRTPDVDGWRNADAGACQHWRPGCSAPTDAAVRGRSVSGAKLTALAALPRRSARLEFDLVEVHTLSHGAVCVFVWAEIKEARAICCDPRL